MPVKKFPGISEPVLTHWDGLEIVRNSVEPYTGIYDESHQRVEVLGS